MTMASVHFPDGLLVSACASPSWSIELSLTNSVSSRCLHSGVGRVGNSPRQQKFEFRLAMRCHLDVIETLYRGAATLLVETIANPVNRWGAFEVWIAF